MYWMHCCWHKIEKTSLTFQSIDWRKKGDGVKNLCYVLCIWSWWVHWWVYGFVPIPCKSSGLLSVFYESIQKKEWDVTCGQLPLFLFWLSFSYLNFWEAPPLINLCWKRLPINLRLWLVNDHDWSGHNMYVETLDKGKT